MPACLSACLPACLPAYLPTCLPAYLPAYLPADLEEGRGGEGEGKEMGRGVRGGGLPTQPDPPHFSPPWSWAAAMWLPSARPEVFMAPPLRTAQFFLGS